MFCEVGRRSGSLKTRFAAGRTRFVSRLSSLEAREARILAQYSCSLLVIHTVLAKNGRLERECFVRLGGVLEL